MKVTAQFDMKLPSVANLREHWRTKANRSKVQRRVTYVYLCQLAPSGKQFTAPIAITLTRIGVRKLDDDNLASAFKAVRDSVADWLRIDDGSESLRWKYAQRKGKPCAVEIVIEGSI